MLDIFAGEIKDLRWDTTSKAFRPAAGIDTGPTFQIRSVDFWQVQAVHADGLTPAEKIKTWLQLGLVAIDGDEAQAGKFIEHPRTSLVNPLFDAIVEHTSGN